MKFTWCEKFTRCIEGLPKDMAYELFMAIIRYGSDGTEPDLDTPLDSFFELFREDIDYSHNRRESGARGGSSETASKQSETASKLSGTASKLPETASKLSGTASSSSEQLEAKQASKQAIQASNTGKARQAKRRKADKQGTGFSVYEKGEEVGSHGDVYSRL